MSFRNEKRKQLFFNCLTPPPEDHVIDYLSGPFDVVTKQKDISTAKTLCLI